MAAPMRVARSLFRTKVFPFNSTKCRPLSHTTDVTDGEKTVEVSGELSSQSESIKESKPSPQMGGFARAFEKIEQLGKHEKEPEQSFATLLRHSKFMQLGDPEGRIVIGRITEVVGDDLYIDFGGKFHCVCRRPPVRSSEYHRGVRVKLRLKDMEMSSRFLGAEKDITLLEADAQLIGLLRPPKSSRDATTTQTSTESPVAESNV